MSAFHGETPSTSFQRERTEPQLFSEMLPLLTAHWKEVAHFPDIPLNPDLSYYICAEAAGMVRTFTFRRDGKLIGYAVFVLRANPHYCQSLQAQQDIVYIDPAARGIQSIKFLKYCDEQLKADGVQAVYHHVKAAHNFGKVLERQGYELVDLIYTKRLDKEE